MRKDRPIALARIFDALDAESRQRLGGLAFKVLVVIPLSTLLWMRQGLPVVPTIAFFCFWFGVFAGVAGLIRHQWRVYDGFTAFDEMAVFLAMSLLIRLVAATLA